MIDELFKFYCKQLKKAYLFNLPESTTKKSQIIWMIIYFIISIILMVSSGICLLVDQLIPYFILMLLLIVFIFIFSLLYNRKFSDVVKSCKIDLKNNIKKELNRLGISFDDSKLAAEKISKLSQAYADRSKIVKFEFPIFPSMMAALIVALFNQFINYITKDSYFISTDNGIRVFVFILCIIIIIFVLYSFVIAPFFKEILNTKHQKMVQLSELLKSISLETYLFWDNKCLQEKILRGNNA
jgi:hypothetical protein